MMEKRFLKDEKGQFFVTDAALAGSFMFFFGMLLVPLINPQPMDTEYINMSRLSGAINNNTLLAKYKVTNSGNYESAEYSLPYQVAINDLIDRGYNNELKSMAKDRNITGQGDYKKPKNVLASFMGNIGEEYDPLKIHYKIMWDNLNSSDNEEVYTYSNGSYPPSPSSVKTRVVHRTPIMTYDNNGYYMRVVLWR